MRKTKEILYLAYYFPPMGMGGVLRTVNFCKYLPEYGYIPTIITPKPLYYHAFDYSLLKEIPESVEIIRTGSFEPLRLLKIISEMKLEFFKKKPEKRQEVSARSANMGKFIRALIPPDEKILWHPFLIPKALELIKKRKFSAFITTGPPESIHLAGLVIHKLTGIPWVADFRDAWITNLLKKDQPFISKKVEEFMERTILKNSTAVIAITDELKVSFIDRYPEIDKSKITTITNGFDPQEKDWHSPQKDTEKMVITHCGNFSGFQTALYFLEPLQELLQEKPEISDIIEVRFVGAMKEDEIEMIQNSKLKEVVNIAGYLPHKLTLEEELNSDILLLLAHPDIERTRILGKTFEYLWARRPVLAIAPEGATTNLLLREGQCIAVHPDDKDGIKKAILQLLDEYKKNGFPPIKIKNYIKYSRRNLTGKLADLLNSL